MKIAIGCDEAAYSLKKIIIDHLSNRDDEIGRAHV